MRLASIRPEVLFSGRSVWVISPVMTALELNPIRVRNIFICSVVVFWASSRMTKASFRVRPRMNARGATSIIPWFIRRAAFSKRIMSCKASYSGRRYGSTFSARSPGKKPRASPASTAGRVRMIRSMLPLESAATAMAMARYVFPVPAGPMPKTMSLERMASMYSFWATLLGVTAFFLAVTKAVSMKMSFNLIRSSWLKARTA